MENVFDIDIGDIGQAFEADVDVDKWKDRKLIQFFED